MDDPSLNPPDSRDPEPPEVIAAREEAVRRLIMAPTEMLADRIVAVLDHDIKLHWSAWIDADERHVITDRWRYLIIKELVNRP